MWTRPITMWTTKILCNLLIQFISLVALCSCVSFLHFSVRTFFIAVWWRVCPSIMITMCSTHIILFHYFPFVAISFLLPQQFQMAPIHQHYFCAHLSKGKTFRLLGRPCPFSYKRQWWSEWGTRGEREREWEVRERKREREGERDQENGKDKRTVDPTVFLTFINDHWDKSMRLASIGPRGGNENKNDRYRITANVTSMCKAEREGKKKHNKKEKLGRRCTVGQWILKAHQKE